MKPRDLDVKPFDLMHTEQLRTIKPPKMIIEQFLPSGGVMGVTSYPGVGKTWLMMEIVRAVVTGTPFLGSYPVNIRGPVLFVGSDSSVFDYARQWTRLTSDTSEGALAHAWFLLQSSFMLDDDEEISRLIRTSLDYVVERNVVTEQADESTGETWEHVSDRRNFEVIIFDTLSRLSRSNQNDNTEMEEVFRNIRDVSEATGAACIVLHHNAKRTEYNDGDDWRGAMSQIGALDSWVHLTKVNKAEKVSVLVGGEFKKFRGITPENFAYRMEVGDEANASLHTVVEAVTRQEVAEERITGDDLYLALVAEIATNSDLRASAYRNILHPRFEDEFPDKKKFTNAVNNRLKVMVNLGRVTKAKNELGATTYAPAVTDEIEEGEGKP